ncbi:MAG TPA: tRNA epoxyqueuosine(34) reductase QueG [Rikenellaceae bacterium]|nr:tRNA epoxyqueuosine(34) reductase QueG [Rikenellaceae bacterium]
MSLEKLHKIINDFSSEIGFVAYGAIPVKNFIKETQFLMQSLELSYNGSMKYLAGNINIRQTPRLLLEGAKSIMVFLAPYKPTTRQSPELPQISSYAYGRDYHPVIKDKLHKVAEKLKENIPGAQYRVFTDSAPIFERAAAEAAGLGFIGRNTFLISKEHGLHTLIGIIITTEQLYYNNEVVKNGCGTCTRCLDSCPTGALVEQYRLDSRRCISYQTIEDKSLFDEQLLRTDRKGWVFGCEICLNICPWSKKGESSKWGEFKPFATHPGKTSISFTPEEWLRMTEEEFNTFFRHSPLKRAGLFKIKDNIVNSQL